MGEKKHLHMCLLHLVTQVQKEYFQRVKNLRRLAKNLSALQHGFRYCVFLVKTCDTEASKEKNIKSAKADYKLFPFTKELSSIC